MLSLSCYKNQIHCKLNSYQNHVYKLDPIIIGDDANLFYSHKDIKTFFHIVNTELVKVDHWFKANKLSLNVKKKTNCSLFHKPSTKEDILLKISELVISNKLIERKRLINFLGAILDKCVTWKD